jgi:putative ABC transport system permease protein
VKGVSRAEGSVYGYARLLGKNGDPLGKPEFGFPSVGTNWIDSKELNPFRMYQGTAPRGDDEIVIDRKTALDGKLAVGDVTTVLVQAGPQRVRISGIAKFGTVDSPGGATFVMFADSAAQRLVAEPGQLTGIAVLGDGSVSRTDLAGRVRAVLPSNAEALTSAQITKQNQSLLRKGFSFFNTFMLIFAVVALLVGGFMIFNTFSITVAQRTRENGLLRALGATQRQVRATVLIEAAVVGVLASLLGLVGGVLVAGGLKAMLAGFGFDVPTGPVVFAFRTVVWSLVAGVGITFISAVSPARKAAKVSPMAAMRTDIAGSTGYGSKERVFVGLGFLALGVVTLMVGLFGSTGNTIAVVGIGMLIVFFAVSVLGRTVSLPLSKALGVPILRMRGAAGTLARENATRNPKRTAASASALMIGVGLVGFITILASSTKVSISRAIDRAVTGDVVVTGGGGFQGGVDPGLAKRLNGLPEVGSATGLRVNFASVEGKPQTITAVDRQTGAKVIDVKPLHGSITDLGSGAIGIYKDVATDKHLKVGDSVHVLFRDSGEQALRVALIYGEKQAVSESSYLLGIEAYDANYADHFDSTVFVKAAPGVKPAAALAAVKNVATAYPGAKALDQTGFKREQTRGVNTILGLVYAMLALAIVIALLGIGNTLALAIFERTRELGVLRAVGMTRPQLRSAIRWESVIIALQGTVLGLAIAVFFGWSLVRALADQGVDTFALPVGSLAVVVVLAALAGVLAAVAPSRRASRLNVLAAITSE